VKQSSTVSLHQELSKIDKV